MSNAALPSVLTSWRPGFSKPPDRWTVWHVQLSITKLIFSSVTLQEQKKSGRKWQWRCIVRSSQGNKLPLGQIPPSHPFWLTQHFVKDRSNYPNTSSHQKSFKPFNTVNPEWPKCVNCNVDMKDGIKLDTLESSPVQFYRCFVNFFNYIYPFPHLLLNTTPCFLATQHCVSISATYIILSLWTPSRLC